MFIYYAYNIRMYIATIPNRNAPPAILIRESYRDHGKVKSRTIANISSWDPARIESLRRALRGDFDHLAGADPTVGPVFGLLYVLGRLAEELGITAAVGSATCVRAPREQDSRPCVHLHACHEDQPGDGETVAGCLQHNGLGSAHNHPCRMPHKS
jgi:hypothetical protein